MQVSGVVLPVVDLRVVAQEVIETSTAECTFTVNRLAQLYRPCLDPPRVVTPLCRAWIAACCDCRLYEVRSGLSRTRRAMIGICFVSWLNRSVRQSNLLFSNISCMIQFEARVTIASEADTLNIVTATDVTNC